MRLRTTLVAILLLFVLSVSGIHAAEVDTAIKSDPAIPDIEDRTVFSPKLRDVWNTALKRPEIDSRLRAAQALADAHNRGMTDLGETIPLLKQQFLASKNSDVRLAIAKALVRLDAKSVADDLAAAAATASFDMALIVEPALARWNYAPIQEAWLARLADDSTSNRQRMLAISGLTTVGEQQAASRFAALALDPVAPVEVRLEAARGLGLLQQSGLEDSVTKLASDTGTAGVLNRLIAASMLAHHSGKQAEAILLDLAVDTEPAVAAIALQRLLTIDPHLVTRHNEEIVASPDAKVRALAVKLLRGQATAASTKLLGPMLSDPHPGVRRAAQESLIELASLEKLDPVVRTAVTQVLTGEAVYGIQEAALALGALDHEPAADRLVELLEHKDATIMLNSAWALRQLAVPATGDAIFGKIQREAKRSSDLREELGRQMKADPTGVLDVPKMNPTYDQIEQLLQALAAINYTAALPHLKEYYPKPALPAITDPPMLDTVAQPDLRASAIWTTGILKAGKVDAAFSTMCQGRIRDSDPSNPEATSVQAMAAVAIGRMQDESALKTLCRAENMYDGYGWLAGASRWAIEQITGDELPAPQPRELTELGWFLEPLDF